MRKFAGMEKTSYLCTRFRKKCKDRDLAQLVAHTSGGREVAGSSPVIPTKMKEADNRKVSASFLCYIDLLRLICWVTLKVERFGIE